MPSVTELVAWAIIHTDFNGETPSSNTASETYRAATIATNLTAEAWEEANGHPVGATVDDSTRNAVALALVAHADALNRQAQLEDAADLAFSIQCGDLDSNGGPLPYARYMSAA